MRRALTAVAAAVSMSLGAPAFAQQQGQQQTEKQAQQDQRKGIVSATGKVVGNLNLKGSAGTMNQLVKLEKSSGEQVVVDLGTGGPMVSDGDRVFVTGHAARINSRPVIIARYVAELQEVTRAEDSAAAGGTAGGDRWSADNNWANDRFGLFDEDLSWTADDSGFDEFYGRADDAWGNYYDDVGDEGLFDV